MSARTKRLRRFIVVALLTFAAITFGSFVVSSEAMANPVYKAVDSDNDPYSGIYLRNGTSMSNVNRTTTRYITYGTSLELLCGTNGEAVGPYNNKRWHSVKVLTGNTAGQTGWIADRYVNTPNKANQPTPGETECGGNATLANATTTKKSTTVNGTNVGYSQGARHAWGNCTVEDFKGGPLDWVIVSYTGSTQIVRNGMLFGWFDNGGAPGMGCPKNQEYTYANGVRQDFTGGSLYWFNGMNHAVKIDSKTEAAVKWAWDCKVNGNCSYAGAANYDGWCLAFAKDALSKSGIDVTRDVNLPASAVRDGISAYEYWNYWTAGTHHSGDTNAPRGTLVFWGNERSADGHVAISLGNGHALSTHFGKNSYNEPSANESRIHVIKIADYPTAYKGWVSA